MADSNKDHIGDFGELLAAVDLSRPVKGRYQRPLFKPTHLGGKFPTVDYLVDVLAADSSSVGFFFVQVKSTSQGLNNINKLPIGVEQIKFNRLAEIPAPTYLIGVDTIAEVSYIVAAYKRRTAAVSSIVCDFSLRDDEIKIDLYKEVIQFWQANKSLLRKTRFKDV